MAKPRSVVKEQFWRTKLASWRASGLGVRAFCDRHALAEGSFYQWRRELARRDRQTLRDEDGRHSPGPAFVPVQVVADGEPSPATIEIVFHGGPVVRVGRGVDQVTLVAVLDVLDQRSC